MIATRHNDNRRSGAYLDETTLAPHTIGKEAFGRVKVLRVMGATCAQPLVASQVNVQGKPTEMLVVATTHNVVYAFDATSGTKIWQKSLGDAIGLPNSQIGPSNYHDMEWEVGILSTPVVDTTADALWVVSTSISNTTISHFLFKLQLSTGAEIKKTEIAAQVGNVRFVSHRHLQRSALLLSNGRLYIAFASYGDATPYHGWVIGYDAGTLAQSGVFCVTPHGAEGQGGIWQAGEGPCADDSGNIYLLTGNGAFDPANGDYGDCAVKLDEMLAVKSHFSPYNNQYLDDNDLDLGSGGLLAIPGTTLVVGGGKEAILYLMDMNDLGGYHPEGDRVLQRVFASTVDGRHHIHGTPVFWKGSNGTGGSERRIFVWPENDQMKAFRLDAVNEGLRFNPTPVAQTTITDPNDAPGGTRGMPGGFMSISASGETNGIVWALHPWNEDLNQKIGQGVLRAFDATTLEQKYSSKQNVGRDDFGNLAKFCPPTINKGRVYIASMGGIERKVTLTQPLVGTPALVSRGNAGLLAAWTGTGRHLNLMHSRDGMTWQTQHKLNETTNHSLALAYNATTDVVYLAWAGSDGRLNVMPSIAGRYDSWGNKKTLGEGSDHGPALVCGKGCLMLAWTGTDGRLNIAFSDNGTDWRKTTLEERCPTEPSVAFQDDRFFLVWNCNDPGRRLNLMAFDKSGKTVVTKRTYEETSDWRPALTFDDDGIGRLSWAGRGNGLINEALLASSFDVLQYKRTFYDTAPNGPALCLHAGQVFVTWACTGGAGDLNVAELSRGGISIYGALGVTGQAIA